MEQYVFMLTFTDLIHTFDVYVIRYISNDQVLNWGRASRATAGAPSVGGAPSGTQTNTRYNQVMRSKISNSYVI